VRDRTAYDGVLALTNFIDDEKPLCAKVDENMRITAFSDRKDGFEWATGGLYYFTPRIFNAVEEALYFSVKRLSNFLRMLLDRNYSIYGYAFSKIIDVDHVSDIRIAEQFIRQEARR
jgi:NDP-sugar pyrophosphorylase family protein